MLFYPMLMYRTKITSEETFIVFGCLVSLTLYIGLCDTGSHSRIPQRYLNADLYFFYCINVSVFLPSNTCTIYSISILLFFFL